MGMAHCSFHLQRTIIFDLIMHGEPGISLRLCVFTVEWKLVRGQWLPSSSVVVRGLLKAGSGVLSRLPVSGLLHWQILQAFPFSSAFN